KPGDRSMCRRAFGAGARSLCRVRCTASKIGCLTNFLFCGTCLAGLVVLQPGMGVFQFGEIGVGVGPGSDQTAVVGCGCGVVFGCGVGAGDAVERVSGVGTLLEGIFVGLFGLGQPSGAQQGIAAGFANRADVVRRLAIAEGGFCVGGLLEGCVSVSRLVLGGEQRAL